jgi:hypothetical protein
MGSLYMREMGCKGNNVGDFNDVSEVHGTVRENR